MKREGLCECGCGGRTSLITRSNRSRGLVKGQYHRYIVNHDKRRPVAGYRVEDRGYKTPCWIFLGHIGRHGYGKATCPRTRRQTTAHRIYYEQRYGPIPPGTEPDHLCRVHECVNPEHLEPVSRSENNARGLLGKLSIEQVEAIRASDLTNLELARRYGVTRQHIGAIRSGRARKG